MSQETVEVVRKGYDAVNRGDLNALADLFAPDATVHPLEDWPDSFIRRGREEFLRLFGELQEPFERTEVRAMKLIDSGDYVVAENHFRGVIKGTEDEVEWRGGLSWTFRNGQATDMSFFHSFDDALAAVGLSE